MAFRFLHAADIHLDSPMAGVLGRDDLPAEVIRGCTRRAFEAMVKLAIDEDVAFVVIAGDLYDGDWKNHSTGLYFAEQMRRLDRPCFLLRGNHDAQSVITRALRPPGNVREFSSRTCDTFDLPELGVALHGHSFPNRAVPEDLSAAYKERRSGMLNIGVLHTSADDPGEHAVYAPCTVPSLRLKGYDYWALGHIHAHAVLEKRQPWIVFPGNLQGRHIRETGAKGCMLVTVEDRQVVDVEHRAVDVLRWAPLPVDVDGADAITLLARIADRVQATLAASDGRPVLARLTLTGATPLHGRLMGDVDRLAAECRAAALDAKGDLWVEKVEVRTRLPASTDADAGAFAALRTAFAGALEDPALVARLLRDLAELRQKLPVDARVTLDVPLDDAGLRAIAVDAWAIAADALEATES
jgi:exonuclease SbcD